MIRTFCMHETEIDENDPWSGVLSATMFATRATLHTTLQATPSQLVFGRDAIMNIKHEANWKFIWQNICVIEERTRICDPIFGVWVDTEFVRPEIREFGIYIYLGIV